MPSGIDFEPTEEQLKIIKESSALGITQEDIADEIGVTAKTLRSNRKAYKAFKEGKRTANKIVAGHLFSKAQNDVTAMIFWLKTQARWSETQKVEVDMPALLPNITPKGKDDYDDDE